MKISDIYEYEKKYPYIWNEKTILWDNGEFYIATGRSDNTYLTLWDRNNKQKGAIDASIINKKDYGKRAKINLVRIDSGNRGSGLGQILYKVMLEWLPIDVKGIYSYLPDRSNKKQVPNIYNKLGGYVVDDDHAYIDR